MERGELSPDLESDVRDALVTAREHLRAAHGHHVSFVLADAAALPLEKAADAIFSTGSFHWALDHPALFASLFRALKRGGRLVAQCGGGPNVRLLRDRAAALMQEARFKPSSPDVLADA